MVQCDADKKVIDYNDLIAEKLSKLQNNSEHSNDEKNGVDEAGFKAGLLAREVEINEETGSLEPEITPEEILKNANEEASQILEEAKKQAEELKQQAYQESSKQGYDDGYKQSMSDLDQEKDKLEAQRKKLTNEYNEQLKEMEPLLVDAITTIVQNVFKVKFEDNRNMIVHLLKIALSQIDGSKEFYVKVSKTDYPFVLKYKEVLEKTVVKAASIEIMEDITLSKNQCLIETDGGVFDCSLDVQLDNLVKTLKILSRS